MLSWMRNREGQVHTSPYAAIHRRRITIGGSQYGQGGQPTELGRTSAAGRIPGSEQTIQHLKPATNSG